MSVVTKVKVTKGHDGKFYASAFARNGKSIETFGPDQGLHEVRCGQAARSVCSYGQIARWSQLSV